MREGERAHDADLTAIRVISCSDGLGIAEVGSVSLIVWRAPVTGPRFERQREALEDVVRRYPGRAGVVCVIEASSPVPSEKYRNALTQLYASLGERLRCIVCVIEGNGFIAAAARSALSGMALMQPVRRANMKITASVEASVPWLENHYDSAIANQLCMAHVQLTRVLAAASAR